MKQSGSAQIIIYRCKSALWSWKPFKVYVDGKKVEGVYNDEACKFFVSPACHSIQVKAGRHKSEIVTIDLNIDSIIRLECGFKSHDFDDRDIFQLFKSLKHGIYLTEITEVSKSAQIDYQLSMSMEQKVRKSFLRTLSKVFLVIGVVGALGFLNGFLTAWGLAPWVTSRTELPLSDIGSIAVDSKGCTYLATYFYYRIQKYSPEGKFLKGWPSNDNDPRIRINEYDQLELANDNATRSEDFPDTLTTYDSEGNLIGTKISDGCYKAFSKDTERFCRDKNGNVYSIHNKLIWPRIMKTTTSGVKTKAVNWPFYLWFIQGPLPAWLFFAVGLVACQKLRDYALLLKSKIDKRKRQKIRKD